MSSVSPFPYQAVVWDWNGTLLDDAELCVQSMNRVLAAYGLPPLDAARYQALFRFPVVEYYRALGFDFDRHPFERVGLEFMDHYEARRTECRLRPGAREALASVRHAGVGQFVLSAYQERRLRSLLGHHGLSGFFDGVAGGGDDFAHGKVERALAWRASWASPEGARVLLIGDTDHDADVARAMGADCWLIAGGHQSYERLRAIGTPLYADLETMPLPRGE